MPKLSLLLLLLICVTAKSQSKDTLFLKRVLKDTPYPFYNAIYIDSNYNFNAPQSLIDFSFKKYDSITYFQELIELKPLTKRHTLPINFPQQWILLYKYKNEYYTYSPSEFGNRYKFSITDSVTIDHTMEGPEPSKIKKIEINSPNSITIHRKNYWKGTQININIINPEKGMAVFTFSPTKFISAEYKLLMVSVKNVNRFKTIINFCETDKMPEYDFDPIDFTELEK